jgi:hypothetical protein
MSIRCSMGLHKWTGCECEICRQERHKWEGCKCSICGQVEYQKHTWQGCICTTCGYKRDEQHTWEGCKCRICGQRRNEEHTWEGSKCTTCGYSRDTQYKLRLEIQQRTADGPVAWPELNWLDLKVWHEECYWGRIDCFQTGNHISLVCRKCGIHEDINESDAMDMVTTAIDGYSRKMQNGSARVSQRPYPDAPRLPTKRGLVLTQADHYIIRAFPPGPHGVEGLIDSVLHANGYARGHATVGYGVSSSIDEAYMTGLMFSYETQTGHHCDPKRSRIHNFTGTASGMLLAIFHSA